MSLLTRRTTLALLAGTFASLATSKVPAPGAPTDLDALPAWLKARLQHDSPDALLRDAMKLAVQRCALEHDPHALLLAGPARRIGSTPELVLWVYFHVLQLPTAGCASKRAVSAHDEEALVQACIAPQSDVHPMLVAAELLDLGAYALSEPTLEALASDERIEPLVVDAVRDGRPVEPGPLAQRILFSREQLEPQLADGAPDPASLWQGVWLAAALAQHGEDAPLDPTHCMTGVAGLWRLAKRKPEHSAALALSAALRIARFGPRLTTVPLVGAPVGRSAWLARGSRPGADVHDLKLAEAVLQAPESVAADVRALAAVSNRFQPAPDDPAYSRLLATFRALP